MTLEALQDLNKLEPFGMGNPKVKYNICINTPIFDRI